MENTELSLDQLQQISGGGWFSNLLSAEEVIDYWADKLVGGTADNIKTSVDKVNDLDTGVYHPPGSDDPGPGVLH